MAEDVVICDRHVRLSGRSVTPAGDVAPWFGLLMLELFEACGVKATELRTRIYARDLADVPPRAVIDAARRALRSGGGYMPSIAEIRRQLEPSAEDRALLAWSALERAAERVGAWESVAIDDPAAAAALVDVFGSWASFCECEQGADSHVQRQHFLAAYRAAERRRGQFPDGPVVLAGRLAALGRYDGPPRLVGAAALTALPASGPATPARVGP